MESLGIILAFHNFGAGIAEVKLVDNIYFVPMDKKFISKIIMMNLRLSK